MQHPKDTRCCIIDNICYDKIWQCLSPCYLKIMACHSEKYLLFPWYSLWMNAFLSFLVSFALAVGTKLGIIS